MSAGSKNLIIDQGADWYINFTYKDSSDNIINLAGYNATLQFRTNYDAAEPAINLTSGYLGVGYESTTSDLISIGSTTFTVSKTALFTVGQRVRAASKSYPENFQEGLVTAKVTDSSVTINVDQTGGEGTFADWIFSSADPGITIVPGTTLASDQNHISIHATASETGSSGTPVAGDYVYDLELTSSTGIVTRLIQGRATLRPQVTK